MSRRSDPPVPFTAPERDLLRRELCRHFGEDPRVADGIFLRTWRGGERRNEPKIPPAVQTMLERGLVEVRNPAWSAVFTPGSPATAAGFEVQIDNRGASGGSDVAARKGAWQLRTVSLSFCTPE